MIQTQGKEIQVKEQAAILIGEVEQMLEKIQRIAKTFVQMLKKQYLLCSITLKATILSTVLNLRGICL